MNMLTINENDYQLIERFFDRTLDRTALAQFEKRLQKDTHFSEQVELYEYAQSKVVELYNPTQKENAQRFKTQLNALKKKKRSDDSQRKMIWTTLSAAATIALLIFCGLPFINPSPSMDRLIPQANTIASQINIEPITSTIRAAAKEGINEPTNQASLLNAFQQEEYATVFQIFDQLEKNEITEEIRLIVGIAYRKAGQIEQAVFYLEKVQVQRDIALWNLATMYLEQEPRNKTKAKEYLNILIKEEFNSTEELAKQIIDAL